MNVQEKCEFIFSNANLLTDYDIRNIYLRTIRVAIKNQYGVYVEESFLSEDLSYKENWEKFLYNDIIPKYHSTENFKFYQDFEYIGRQIYGLDTTNLNRIEMQASQLSIDFLVFLMLYVVNNEIGEDLSHAIAIVDNLKLSHNIDSFEFNIPEVFGNANVKKQKNGRIIFKNLNEEQIERLEKVYKITHN